MNELRSRFTGVFTALVTPFRDGSIDFAAFDALVERQIAAGVAGLVPVGDSGDAMGPSGFEEGIFVRTFVVLEESSTKVVSTCVVRPCRVPARGMKPFLGELGLDSTL